VRLAIVLVLSAVAGNVWAQAKVAVVDLQRAVMQTQEGQAHTREVEAKYTPMKAALERDFAEIAALEERLKVTTSPEDRRRLEAEIGRRRQGLEPGCGESERQPDEVASEITRRLREVIETFAKAGGYTVVMDARAPLLWVSASVNITPEIIKAYDAAHPVKK
jgi:outer membrane protein